MPGGPNNSSLIQHTKELTVGTSVRVDACRLIQTTGESAGREYTLSRPETLVGTAPECHIRLNEATVSRQHFKVLQDGDTYRVVDLGSTNGTFVDGAKISDAFLRPGSVIAAGGIHFKFETLIDEEEFAPSDESNFFSLQGQSIRMREIFGVLQRVAPTDATILIVGQTGTGKSAIAKAIHEASSRRDGPFRVVDCGAIAPSLVESELFGHERGAFTGAVKQRSGALEAASGGTLFIDELTDLSPHLQPKLLRAIEERELIRVGGNEPIRFDCRIIAASQHDLWEKVEAEEFRSDLYFRLAVVQLQLPSLAERREDIPMLVDHFLDQIGSTEVKTFSDLDADLQRKLMAHTWPGNLRELRNTVERVALMFGRDPFVQPGGRRRAGPPGRAVGNDPDRAAFEVELALPYKDAKESLLAEFEKVYLTRLLERSGGSIAQAARDAGLDRKHIYNLAAKHGIQTK